MNLINKVKNNPRLLRFGLVGGVNTALDFGLLFGFKALGVPVELANIFSTGIAFIFSFFANKKYTFKATGTNIIREIILFIIVTLFGLWVIQTIIIFLLQPPLLALFHNGAIALFVAKLIATLASLTWNYLLYSRLVFTSPKPTS